MIPKDKRISQAVFKDLLKRGRFLDGDFLTLRFTSSRNNTKVAFVVPKNVARTAVARNTRRRRGYEAFQVLNPLPSSPLVFAFFFKKTKKIPTYEEIYKQISFLLKKTGAI